MSAEADAPREAHGGWRWAQAHGLVGPASSSRGGGRERPGPLSRDRPSPPTTLRDALTGLPNRGLFLEHLSRAMERVRQDPESRIAVLALDLDRFKIVNDGLGHAAGDRVLVATAQTIASCLRAEDLVARFGGDEFAILLEGLHEVTDATQAAHRIQLALEAALPLGDRSVFTSASIGIALGEAAATGGQGPRPDELLRDADIAMSRAKARGPASYEVFDREMHRRAVALLRLESELRQALERGELHLFYQPIVEVRTRRIRGFEALLRWAHPDRGVIAPGAFLPVARETGLIVPIGRWALRLACRQTRAWQQRYGDSSLGVSVNLCSRQFIQPQLVQEILEITEEEGLLPASLMLEVTESLVMEDTDHAAAMLAQLREHRIRVSIDDFGTGYSSLAYLHRFPFDTLKIDHSFVRQMEQLGEGVELVRTITRLAHNLGMDVIAEGVETEGQLARLTALGCEAVQGHMFGRPVPAEQVEFLLGGRS